MGEDARKGVFRFSFWGLFPASGQLPPMMSRMPAAPLPTLLFALALGLPIALIAACGEAGGKKAGSSPDTASTKLPEPTTRAIVIPVANHDGKINVDGSSADASWKTAREISVPLHGPGPERVAVRAVRNPIGFYLLLKWRDPEFDTAKSCYYYVRIEQANGEEAISSPVWVD